MTEPAWRRHEREVADWLGLTTTPGSGNQFHAPGDAVDNARLLDSPYALMVDCKQTAKKSYSMTSAFLRQAHRTAAERGKRFVLALRFSTESPIPAYADQDYVVVALHDFIEILEAARGADTVG